VTPIHHGWVIALLVVFLLLLALITGYLMGIAVGYSTGAHDGLATGIREYQEAYCQDYPFTLLDRAHFQACRKLDGSQAHP